MNETPKRKLSVTTAALLIAFASLLVTLIVAGVAIRATNAADKAQDAIDEVVAQRTESRGNVCRAIEGFATAHNSLVIAIATSAGTREIPPALQPKVDEQLVPVPDCSTPDGIRGLFEGAKP